MIIYTFEQLIDFITEYFSFINNALWKDLLCFSLGVYENHKPKTLSDAISLLNDWHQIAKTGQESPLFLN
jgi:hypothetical protein